MRIDILTGNPIALCLSMIYLYFPYYNMCIECILVDGKLRRCGCPYSAYCTPLVIE